MIGWMHLRGEGVKANNATAKHFFEEGAARNDALSLGCLGIMLIDEGKEEVGRKYLERSVAKGWAEAQVQMGLYYLSKSLYVRRFLSLILFQMDLKLTLSKRLNILPRLSQKVFSNYYSCFVI